MHVTSCSISQSYVWPQYGKSILPCAAVANRAKNLLTTFFFLQSFLEEDYFTLTMFHHIMIYRVSECRSLLWVHIDVNTPHEVLNNMFARGAATIAANIQDYQLGTWDVQEVTLDNWLLDYHKSHALIRIIWWDTVWQAVLDGVQWWIMDISMAIVTQNPTYILEINI